jgi:D-glycero-D-manno-heptose 1,7-bisphosphate phosphatase
MNVKNYARILYFGKYISVFCDRECPPDDHTFEGRDGRPETPDSFPNKWCVRRCGKCVLCYLHIFDADGTLRRAKSNSFAPSSPDDWELLPGVRKWFIDNKPLWGIASNQGGVAFGKVKSEYAYEALQRTAASLGGLPNEAIRMETSFDKRNPRRKPNPWMLVELIEHYNISSERTLMVGDMESDKQAAEAAGCHYIHPRDLFGWEN